MDKRKIDEEFNNLSHAYYNGQPLKLDDLRGQESRLVAAEIRFQGESRPRLVFVTDILAENGPGDKFQAIAVEKK